MSETEPTAPRSIRPIGSMVLVRQDPEQETTSGGLIMPQGVRDRWNNFATVLAVGPGTTMPGGWLSQPDVNVGDRILFIRRAGTALIPDSREGGPEEFKDLLMLAESDIIGVVTPEKVEL